MRLAINTCLAEAKNCQSTEQLRTAIFEYLTTGEPEAEAALFKRLEALDSRAAAASSKAKDLIENLGLELVNAGLLPAKTYYKRARSLSSTHLYQARSGKQDRS